MVRAGSINGVRQQKQWDHGTIYWANADEPLTIGVSVLENGLVLKGTAIDMIQSYGDRLISYGLGYQIYQEERDFVMAVWNIFGAHMTQ